MSCITINNSAANLNQNNNIVLIENNDTFKDFNINQNLQNNLNNLSQNQTTVEEDYHSSEGVHLSRRWKKVLKVIFLPWLW